MSSPLIAPPQKKLFGCSESLGSIGVVADPLDEDAVAFYKKFGFILLPGSDNGDNKLIFENPAFKNL